MAQTLAELELNWDRDHRTLQTLQAQVAALAADNFGLRARVLTLEQNASSHTSATVEQLAKLVSCLNQYGDKFFRVESQQAVVSAPKQPWQEVQ